MEVKIQKTKDYSIFKKQIFNRPLAKGAVRNLALAIQAQNKLHLNPIIVNRNMEIIDGQHRLEAAKRLGVDIYYMVDDAATLKDMISYNAKRVAWQLETYFDFYIKNKNPEYIKLKKVVDTYSMIPISVVITYCSTYRDGETIKTTRLISSGFRDGSWTFKDYETSIMLLSQARDILPYVQLGLHRERLFYRSLLTLFKKPEFDYERFLEKLKTSGDPIVFCGTEREYMRQFEIIINKGTHSKNFLRFIR